ncbi:Rod outer segment membrane protein 1 [Fukomys damarensis]|uniref:Rod outer segment membrane protein 1 n=1 Tax=Fukomys damarensis TaxID=885580 RepID=A0A091DG04_FUKDA|nr:Rod outer segment membrane protein 1 [Fukomys damarensis]
MLALPLPCGSRVRLAQGLWLLSWLLVLADRLELLGAAYLLAQALGTFLAQSCHFPAMPQAVLLAATTALGTELEATSASCASLDGVLGSGGLLVAALGLALALSAGLDIGLQESLGAALAHYKDTKVPGCIQSNVKGLYLTDGVPFSCCNPHSPRPCLQSCLSDPYAHPFFDPWQPNLNLWAQGCREVLLDPLQGLAGTLGSMLAINLLLQVTVLLGLRYLQMALEGLGRDLDGEWETQGYLLPGGLKTACLQRGVPTGQRLLRCPQKRPLPKRTCPRPRCQGGGAGGADVENSAPCWEEATQSQREKMSSSASVAESAG